MLPSCDGCSSTFNPLWYFSWLSRKVLDGNKGHVLCLPKPAGIGYESLKPRQSCSAEESCPSWEVSTPCVSLLFGLQVLVKTGNEQMRAPAGIVRVYCPLWKRVYGGRGFLMTPLSSWRRRRDFSATFFRASSPSVAMISVNSSGANKP